MLIKVIKLEKFIYENIEPYYIDEQGNKIWNIPQDINKLKNAFKDTLDWLTTRYIVEELEKIQEELSDIATEETNIRGRIIRILRKNGINLTTDEIIYKITQYLEGKITDEQVQKELEKYKQLKPEDKIKILNLLKRAVEIAKIIEWKEKIWEIEEQLESQIDQIDNIDELLKLDLRKLVKEKYPSIETIF